METHVVSFSGGRTSAYLVWLMEQKRKLEGWDVHYIFMDTGGEHPKTYKFINDVVNNFSIDITCLRVNINPELGKGNEYSVVPLSECKFDLQPWRDMMSKYGTPYIGGSFCTDRMKLQPFKKYCDDKYGKGNYVTWLGIRSDEPKRLSKKDGINYLADISDFEKPDILSWWNKQEFNLEIDEHLGNCVFCIKKSVNKIALAAKDEPELCAMQCNAINGESVRVVDGRTTPSNVIYRGKNTLESVIAMFSDIDRDELSNSLKRARKYDSGSCSESCEVFSCQLDLFEDQVS